MPGQPQDIRHPTHYTAEQCGLRHSFLRAALAVLRSCRFLDEGTWLHKHCMGLYPMAVET